MWVSAYPMRVAASTSQSTGRLITLPRGRQPCSQPQGRTPALCFLTLLEVARDLHERQVRGRQIGRAADQAGQHGGQRVEHHVAVLAGGQLLVLRLEGRQCRRPAIGQLAADQRLELGKLLQVGKAGGIVGAGSMHSGAGALADVACVWAARHATRHTMGQGQAIHCHARVAQQHGRRRGLVRKGRHSQAAAWVHWAASRGL